MLELRAIGNAEIVTDTTTLTPSQEIIFASALYLLLERERKISRAALAELLWPRVEKSARGHRLRQTLLQLKKLGFPVNATREWVRVSAEQMSIDVEQTRFSELRALPVGKTLEFLPGYSPRFSESFRDWVDGKRSQVNSSSARALLNVLNRARSGANWSVVDHVSRTILEIDPFNETAVLALAEASAMRGQKREAVAILDEYISEVGGNPDIRLPTSLLRRRIVDSPCEASPPLVVDPAFVGRQREVERLTKRLAEAKKGNGGACLLVGDPGIGKSRLAAEVAKFGTFQGFRTQSVTCQPSSADRPLSILVDLVPALRDMPGSIGCSQETLLSLRRLTEFDARGAEFRPAAAESHAVHRALRNAVLDLLDAVTDELPLVLVFDDIQWIDQTSADVLIEMVEFAKRKRLLLLLSSRQTGTTLLASLSYAAAEVVELQALPDSAAGVLLTSVINQRGSTPSNQARRILEAGEGNPFFLQELAKHWLESDGCVYAPPSVSRVLSDRLSRLSSVGLHVLQACTILGHASTVERVEAVLEYSSHQLLGAVQELSRAGMLSSSSNSPPGTSSALRARHDLLGAAVLDSLSGPARAFLHRRAGVVLEKELSGQRVSTALLWACAFHWHHAGNRNRALSVIRSCSEHLLEVGLPDDASHALDRALDYCSTDEQRLSVLGRQVDALQMAGKWQQSKEVLIRCRQLRANTMPVEDQHDAFEIMLFEASYRSSLDVLTLLSETTRCVECVEAAPVHRLQAAIIALKVASDVDPLMMDATYRQLAPLLATTLDNDLTRIEIEMVYHSIRGDGARGLAAARTLVDYARRANDPFRLARALVNASNSCRINGTNDEAEQCLYETIDISLKHHLVERAAIAMHNLVKLRLAAGDVVFARDILEQRKALLTPAENLVTTSDQHVVEARLALKEGNPSLAAEEFAKVPKDSFGYSPSRRCAYVALEIQICVAQGCDPSVLRTLASELETLHRTLWDVGLQDFEAEALFLALNASGEGARALSLLREYLSKHRRERQPVPLYLTELLADPLTPVGRTSVEAA